LVIVGKGRFGIVIEVRVDGRLRGRSFYWLAKEIGINFVTLEKICRALDCQPGDILRLAEESERAGKRAARAKRGRG
jgi:Cro/C1-type HTH DNA-binding domain